MSPLWDRCVLYFCLEELFGKWKRNFPVSTHVCSGGKVMENIESFLVVGVFLSHLIISFGVLEET